MRSSDGENPRVGRAMALPDMTSPSSNRPGWQEEPQCNSGNGYVLSRDLTPQLVPLARLQGAGRESHTHPPRQVRKLAASLERFGFVLPILIDAECRVVAGWGIGAGGPAVGPQRSAGGQADGPVVGACSSSAPASHGDRDRADARSRRPAIVWLPSLQPIVFAASHYAAADAVRSGIR